MINTKYALKLTRRGLTGLILAMILGAAWMFGLGVFVGRSSVPVKFHFRDIKEELTSLKAEDEQKAAPVATIRGLNEKEGLDFYEDLKESNNQKSLPVKRTVSGEGGLKKTVLAKDEAVKPANQAEEGKKDVTIQVASVKDEKTADRMVAELKRHGYMAYKTHVEIPELGTWYRVRVGHYRSRDEASSVVEGLKKNKFKPMLLQE